MPGRCSECSAKGAEKVEVCQKVTAPRIELRTLSEQEMLRIRDDQLHHAAIIASVTLPTFIRSGSCGRLLLSSVDTLSSLAGNARVKAGKHTAVEPARSLSLTHTQHLLLHLSLRTTLATLASPGRRSHGQRLTTHLHASHASRRHSNCSVLFRVYLFSTHPQRVYLNRNKRFRSTSSLFRSCSPLLPAYRIYLCHSGRRISLRTVP